MARSESTWLGILTPIQVNVPYGFVLSCSSSAEGGAFSRSKNKCPSTNQEWERAFLWGITTQIFSPKIVHFAYTCPKAFTITGHWPLACGRCWGRESKNVIFKLQKAPAFLVIKKWLKSKNILSCHLQFIDLIPDIINFSHIADFLT